MAIGLGAVLIEGEFDLEVVLRVSQIDEGEIREIVPVRDIETEGLMVEGDGAI